MGCSQAVRQRFLVACTVGSNPTTPASTFPLIARCECYARSCRLIRGLRRWVCIVDWYVVLNGAQIYHQSEVAVFAVRGCVDCDLQSRDKRGLLCPAYWQAVMLAPIRCKPKRLRAFEDIANDARRKEREIDHLLDVSFRCLIKSQLHSLLSVARLNSDRSQWFSASSSLTLIAHTCLGFCGRF